MNDEPKTVGEALSQIMKQLKELTDRMNELTQELREMRAKNRPHTTPYTTPYTTTTDWEYKYDNGDTTAGNTWITADNKTTAVKLNDKICKKFKKPLKSVI